MLCILFKEGTCTKGDACLFSHDLSIERRSEKKDLYSDNRASESTEALEQGELEKIIEKKHGQTNKNASDKICKHFLEAVEKRLYGWFWVCPNGGDVCKYRHALPPGYVLRRDKAGPVKIDQPSVEDIIESEREKLDGDLTPVTPETFKVWKENRVQEKRHKCNQDLEMKRDEIATGRVTSRITGKEVFSLDASLVNQDDDDEADDIACEQEEIDHNILSYEEIVRIKLSQINIEDDCATKAISLNPSQRVSGFPTDH